MAGRALAFADPDVVRMASQDFVAVTADDWYQRRRDDDEGRFFRGVADQGPRKGQGGSTRQGIYCLTADGQLLAYKNAGQAPDVMRDVLRQALDQWRQLPADRRRPGAVEVPQPASIDARYSRRSPPGGAIINVHARALAHDEKGNLCGADCETGRGDDASYDHLWLTEPDWRALVPAQRQPGERWPLPQHLVQRICRFHLVDNTRGEPNMWGQDELRDARVELLLVSRSDQRTVVRLEGHVLLATGADIAAAERGYDARLLGHIEYDAARGTLDRFDLVALGHHWGDGTYTRGSRPGRTPLGILFRLAAGDPADVVPPQAARDLGAYFAGSEGR